MTNIMSYVKNTLPEEYGQGKLPFEDNIEKPVGQLKLFDKKSITVDGILGVVMADSLGSNEIEKNSGNQKIFPIGNSYLLGTGHGGKIQRVAQELLPYAGYSAGDLSKIVIEIIDEKIVLAPNEPLNFIIMGHGITGIESYHITPTNFKEPKQKNEGLLLDGSGSYFSVKALDRDKNKGLNVRDDSYKTVADITYDLFDLAIAAEKSTGVDLRLQTGIVLPEGIITLFNPTIAFDENFSNCLIHNDSEIFNSFFNTLCQMYELKQNANYLTSLYMSQMPNNIHIEDNLAKIRTDFDNCRGYMNGMMNYLFEKQTSL
jgi:hypothetical protein